MKDKLVIVRGGGDIATGTIQALHRAGFSLLVLEVADPSAIRRQVALSEAVYDETASVEDLTARLCRSGKAIERAWSKGEVPVIIDPKGRSIAELQPWAVVDAILAKRNLGTNKKMARHVVALGPGFTAGVDVDAVIETMRGHDLGRIILEGQAKANTGVPGLIGGYGKERVIHSPAAGRFYGLVRIGSVVEKGQPLGVITKAALPEGYVPGPDDGVPVPASLTGLVRGLIRDSYPVVEGFKIADIDPRQEEMKNCFTVSDKARCIGGAVVTALLWLEGRKCQEAGHEL
ncbi:selenium-dependent molybdenum cofactor biosynthesis protein YqeB [uncultured Megasphaera sp.]|uniref:selenium-dependent molybdenum cofactor biosynthesis protein YqeB n=1 Tax=uncultured Megasphaera sp. TaxID=165188 RepID=UPI00265D4AD2|nr:selenium-dependent molybdenum cofactor biosynthesis protein YqeB [uncultured Megasphaera sp.]